MKDALGKNVGAGVYTDLKKAFRVERMNDGLRIQEAFSRDESERLDYRTARKLYRVESSTLGHDIEELFRMEGYEPGNR